MAVPSGTAFWESMEGISMMRFTESMKADAEQQQPLVAIVARLLAQLVETNDKMPADKEITVFHAQKAPAVSVTDYADRISRYSSCSSCCFVVGMIYVDRFIQQQRMKQIDFRVNSLNVHRLMLASIMVAAKFLDDFYYSNEFWAKIGGVSNAELNTLELEFLFLTNFELQVKREFYDLYRSSLLEWETHPMDNPLGIGIGLTGLHAHAKANQSHTSLVRNAGGSNGVQPDTPGEMAEDHDNDMMADGDIEDHSTPPPISGQSGDAMDDRGGDGMDMEGMDS